MFALVMTLHLLQPTLHLDVTPPMRLEVASADDAVIAPPLPRQPRPAKPAVAPPPALAVADVDLDAGSVGVGDVFAGFGWMVLGHAVALGLYLTAGTMASLLRGSDSAVLVAAFSTGIIADLVLAPLLATTFARLAAGDFIAGSLAKAYARALIVHASAAALALVVVLLGHSQSAAIGVAVVLGIVDLFAAPAAASSGLHAVTDAPAVSPAAALRSELPAFGGLAFAR